MLHLVDILHKVACDMYGYSGQDPEADIEEFMASHANDFNLGITDDVEESEIHYHRKYGAGSTFYFSLHSYEEGKKVAAEFYEFFTGVVPDMSAHTGEQFPTARPLFLFIHVSTTEILTTLSSAIPDAPSSASPPDHL